MTPKHPNARARLQDDRFGDVAYIVAAARPIESANLRESQWQILKGWIANYGSDSNLTPSTKTMAEELRNSAPDDWSPIKTILCRRNWPVILQELSDWRQRNPYWQP